MQCMPSAFSYFFCESAHWALSQFTTGQQSLPRRCSYSAATPPCSWWALSKWLPPAWGFLSTVLSKTFLLSTMPSWLLRQGNGYVYEEASNEKYLGAAICIWQTSIKALSTCLMVFAHALRAHYPKKIALCKKLLQLFVSLAPLQMISISCFCLRNYD